MNGTREMKNDEVVKTRMALGRQVVYFRIKCKMSTAKNVGVLQNHYYLKTLNPASFVVSVTTHWLEYFLNGGAGILKESLLYPS